MPPLRARRVALGSAIVATLIVLLTVVRFWTDGANEGAESDRDAARGSAVRISALGCSLVGHVGMGAMVEGGFVATVAHVVAGSTEITATAADGHSSSATVVAIDRENDLALLEVELDLPGLEIGVPQVGSRVSYAVWRGEEMSVSDTEVQRLVSLTARTIDHDATADRKGLQIAAEVFNGDSGSILVSAGRAVGIVFARSTKESQRGWATDVSELSGLLAGMAGTGDPSAVDVGACT